MNKEFLEKEELASVLRGSLIEFTKYFYKIMNSREFIISQPIGRESHHITIAKALTRASRLQIPNHRLIINVSPGSGKSTLLSYWVAWCMAQYPDSRFLYISYSKVIAAKHSENIKRIMQLSHYNYLFDVKIRHDSKAKEFFQTTAGGSIVALGSSGSVVGQDAGIPGVSRMGGCLILDDPIKVDDAHSDTIRESVIQNYRETIQQRTRGINTPIVFVGQRTHSNDLAQYLIDGKDGYDWEKIILKSIDSAGNALYPEVDTLSKLLKRKETDPYVFSSQYQQEPVPAGGALFKPDWFVLLDEEPEFIATFVVADTAETAMTYNDATAISFFGIYEIENFGVKTGVHALHWIDAIEVHVEPKDLKDTFLSFWENCCRNKKPPKMAAIEKKSTGVSLISALSEMRAVRIMNIDRNRSSGSKTKRFLDIQPFVAERLVSLSRYAKHAEKCITHMSKITANDSHARDDLGDNLADGVRLGLIEKSIMNYSSEDNDYTDIAKSLTSHSNFVGRLRHKAYTS